MHTLEGAQPVIFVRYNTALDKDRDANYYGAYQAGSCLPTKQQSHPKNYTDELERYMRRLKHASMVSLTFSQMELKKRRERRPLDRSARERCERHPLERSDGEITVKMAIEKRGKET